MLEQTTQWPEISKTNKRLVNGIQRTMGDIFPVAREMPVDKFGRHSFTVFDAGICADGLLRASAQKFIKLPTETSETAEPNLIDCYTFKTFGVALENDRVDELDMRPNTKSPVVDFFQRRSAAKRLADIDCLLVFARTLIILGPEANSVDRL